MVLFQLSHCIKQSSSDSNETIEKISMGNISFLFYKENEDAMQLYKNMFYVARNIWL